MTSKLGQKCGVTVVQVDVVSGGVASVKADSLRNNEGDSLGFRLADGLGGSCSALCFVEHFVCEFMDKGAELFGCGLSGKDGDAASVAHAKRWGDALLELKLDTLRNQKVDEAFAVLAYFALHPL